MYLFEEHRAKSWCGYYVTDEATPQKIRIDEDDMGYTGIYNQEGSLCYVTLKHSVNQHKLCFAYYGFDYIIKDPTGKMYPRNNSGYMDLYLFDYEEDLDFKNNINEIKKFLVPEHRIASLLKWNTKFDSIRLQSRTRHSTLIENLHQDIALSDLRSLMVMLEQNMNLFLDGKIEIATFKSTHYKFRIEYIEKIFKDHYSFLDNMIQFCQRYLVKTDFLDNIRDLYPEYFKDLDYIDPEDDYSELF